MSRARSMTPERSGAPLNRERVLRAALDMVDADGLEALSMRRLGATLGVEAMSLYNHVANKDAILDGLCEVMLAEMVADTASEGDARETARSELRALRRVARRHPQAFPLLATRPVGAYAATRDLSERALRRLLDDGWDRDGAMKALRICVRFTLGFAMTETAEEQSGERPDISPAETPLVAELVDQVETTDPDALFEFGLDVVLDGLDAQRGRRSGPV